MATLLLCATAPALAGCSLFAPAATAPAAVEGIYVFESLTLDGQTFTAQDARDRGLDPADFMTIAFTGDRFRLKSAGDVFEGTYTLAEGVLMLTSPNTNFGTQTGTVEGTTVTLTNNNGSLVVFQQ
jgi:hypothetical protein